MPSLLQFGQDLASSDAVLIATSRSSSSSSFLPLLLFAFFWCGDGVEGTDTLVRASRTRCTSCSSYCRAITPLETLLTSSAPLRKGHLQLRHTQGGGRLETKRGKTASALTTGLNTDAPGMSRESAHVQSKPESGTGNPWKLGQINAHFRSIRDTFTGAQTAHSVTKISPMSTLISKYCAFVLSKWKHIRAQTQSSAPPHSTILTSLEVLAHLGAVRDAHQTQTPTELPLAACVLAAAHGRRHTAISHAMRERFFANRPYKAVRWCLAIKVNAQINA